MIDLGLSWDWCFIINGWFPFLVNANRNTSLLNAKSDIKKTPLSAFLKIVIYIIQMFVFYYWTDASSGEISKDCTNLDFVL